MPTRVPACIAAASCAFAATAHAHHSYSEYDDKQIIEIEGTLVRVAMQNPHIHFYVEVVENGRPLVVDLESTSLNWFTRTRVPPDVLRLGSRVKFAGWPSKRSNARMYSLNLLAENGQEVLLFRTATPRWESTTIGFGAEEAQSFFEGGVASDTDTLFRVWASHLGNPETAFQATAPLALTESAKQEVAAFDGVNELTETGCNTKGMPRLMSQPPPMQFIDNGSTIAMRMEEYDSIRTIHMTDATNPETQPKTPLGYSVGRWDGRTLVVETSRVNYPYMTSAGVPLGPSASFVERFTPSDDGSRLDYRLVVTDPDSLLKPAEFKRTWVYRPGEEVLPFECKE